MSQTVGEFFVQRLKQSGHPHHLRLPRRWHQWRSPRPRKGRRGLPLRAHLSGGVRRGTEILKTLALGADAVLAGRAPLYGLCAGSAPGVELALRILQRETLDAMGLLGARSFADVGARFLMPRSMLPMRGSARALCAESN